MNDLDVLRGLAAKDLLYAKRGRPAPVVIEEARQAYGSQGRLFARLAIMGQVSGHEWCYCSLCETVMVMVPTGLKGKDQERYTTDPPPAHGYCKMTPRCLGHMIRIAKRPILRQAALETIVLDLRGMAYAVES